MGQAWPAAVCSKASNSNTSLSTSCRYWCEVLPRRQSTREPRVTAEMLVNCIPSIHPYPYIRIKIPVDKLQQEYMK